MRSSIRAARQADLDAVCAIARDSRFAARWSRAQYGVEIGSSRSEFAVWDDGEVRGYFLLLQAAPEAQLVDLAVRPADRGRGLGRALLGRAAQAARAWNCAKLTLEVSAENAPALSLYRGLGFQVVGRRRKFYNDGSDAILMDLLLA